VEAKATRNLAIAAAVGAGTPLKVLADQYHVSIPRIAQIAHSHRPKVDYQATIQEIHALLIKSEECHVKAHQLLNLIGFTPSK
jgi:hypothetical protein